jgi:hypothetical protein
MIAKLLRPGACLLALACFVLPFLRISCNNQMLMQPKGYQLAFGQEKQKRDSTKIVPATKAEKNADIDVKMQPFILSAFIALTLGFIFSLIGFKFSRTAQFFLALTAISLLVYFYIDYKHQLQIEDSPSDSSVKSLLGDSNMKIDVNFLYGYWLTIGFSAIAMIFSILPLDKKKIIFKDFEDNSTELAPINDQQHSTESPL